MPNRFYRPSTPQYTSQFVEEKYPHEQMLVSQRYKAAKKEQVASQHGQLEALNASITAGARTQDIAPSVKNYWNKKLADSADKMSGMSMQEATRALSRLKNEWMNDKNVQGILRDKSEGDPELSRYKQSGTFGTDIKSWWNKEEGRPNQFGYFGAIPGVEESNDASQSYKGYDPVVKTADYTTPINQLISKIPTDVREESGVEQWTDPDTGKIIKQPYNVSVEYRDINKDQSKIDDIYKNVLAAKDSGDWQNYMIQGLGEEGTRDFIQRAYSKLETRKERARRSAPTGGSGSKTDDTDPRMTVSTPQFEIPKVFSTNFGGLTGKGQVGKVANAEFSGLDKAYKDKEGNYKFDLNHAGELIADHKKMRYATAIQPKLTRINVEKYFEDQIIEENKREGGPREGRISRINNGKERELMQVDKFIDAYYDVDEVSDEAIENTHNKMVLNEEISRDMLESDNFVDRRAVAQAEEKHRENFTDLGYSADIELLHPDEVEELTSIFGGSFIKDGKVDSDKARSMALEGAKLIKLEEPDDEVETDDRVELLGDENIFEVKGFMTDDSSLWGPGLMAVNTSDGPYAMEGSEEYVEQARLPYMLSECSRMMSGIGRPFAVNDVVEDPNNKDGGYFVIADPYNSQRRRANNNKSWYDVKYNYGSIVEKDKDAEPFELRRWTGNPDDENSKPEILYRSKDPIDVKTFNRYSLGDPIQ